MTIEKLDDSCMLISLCKKDMEQLSLDYSKMSLKNAEFRKTIKAVLTVAVCRSGIKSHGKKAYIEAMPHELGCFLLVTFSEYERVPKKYRIKKDKAAVYTFESLDDLLSLVIQASKNNISFFSNTVYELNGDYYLKTDTELSTKADILLREYASGLTKNFNKTMSAISRLEEFGTKIAQGNGIREIGQRFKC